MAIAAIHISIDEQGKLNLRDNSGYSKKNNITTNVKDSCTLSRTSDLDLNTDIGVKPVSPNMFSESSISISDIKLARAIAKYNLPDGIARRDDPIVIVKPH